MRKMTLLLALGLGMVSHAGAATIFAAALSGTDDMAVTASPGAVVAPGYLDGWPEPFLEFSATSSQSTTSQAYVTVDLGAARRTLLSRFMIEFGQEAISEPTRSSPLVLSSSVFPLDSGPHSARQYQR